MAKKILYVNFNLKEAQDGAKVFTKAGQPVKIFYNKERETYPILGILFNRGCEDSSGFDKPVYYDINGRCYNSDGFNNNDLVIGVEVEDKDENKKVAIQEGNMREMKLIPFDVEKAKAGAKVVTRDGHKVDIIIFNGRNSYPISGWIRARASQLIGDSDEYASFTEEGYYNSFNKEDHRDLFIEVEESEKQLLPFDLEKAKAGAQVITRNGRPVTICRYDVKNKDYPILGLVELVDGKEVPQAFTESGKSFNGDDQERPFDLFIEVETKLHRMTNQEFTWWLRECPEEHREYCHKEGTTAHFNYYYSFDEANEEVEESILIRKNGGEWMEPVIYK